MSFNSTFEQWQACFYKIAALHFSLTLFIPKRSASSPKLRGFPYTKSQLGILKKYKRYQSRAVKECFSKDMEFFKILSAADNHDSYDKNQQFANAFLPDNSFHKFIQRLDLLIEWGDLFFLFTKGYDKLEEKKSGPRAMPNKMSIAILWLIEQAGSKDAARKNMIFDFLKPKGEFEQWFNRTYDGKFPFFGYSLNRLNERDFAWLSKLKQGLERNVLKMRDGSRSLSMTPAQQQRLSKLLSDFNVNKAHFTGF